MELTLLRIAAVTLFVIAVGLLLHRRERSFAFIRAFFLEPTGPVNLAVLRIVVFCLLCRSASGAKLTSYGRFPASLREPPPGWGWLGELPFDPTLTTWAPVLLVITSAAAALGLFTRVTAPLAALLAVYVFAPVNFFGKINHGHHARILCALVIASAPSGDALSLDRLWARFRGASAPLPSAAYTLPVRCAWLVIGTTYLFPGFYKLWDAGDLWVCGEQLEHLLRSRWSTKVDFVPLYRIDQHPVLLGLLGTATIVFELGFIVALFWPLSRTVAALSAVGFHLGVGAFMGIWFPPFFPLVILLEVPERYATIRRFIPPSWRDFVATWFTQSLQGVGRRGARWFEPNDHPPSLRGARIPALVGAAVLLGQFVAGAGNINSIPFSVYPAFSARRESSPSTVRETRLEIATSGETYQLEKRLKGLGETRVRRLMASIEKQLQRRKASNDRDVTALLRAVGVELDEGAVLTLYEAQWNLFPLGERTGYRERIRARYVAKGNGTFRRTTRVSFGGPSGLALADGGIRR